VIGCWRWRHIILPETRAQGTVHPTGIWENSRLPYTSVITLDVCRIEYHNAFYDGHICLIRPIYKSKLYGALVTKKRTYARYTLEGLALLGKMIRHGRKQRQMTEIELADRLGIARSTLQRAEKGDPKVEGGIMFEAAAIVGVKLFDSDEKGVTGLSERMDDRIAVLPKHVYKTRKKVLDEF
jgi:transcriptional regulator with XRE-family HTH domain